MAKARKAVVNLSVHRNTVEKRQRDTRVRELVRGAEKMARDTDLRAYAVVGIGADGSAHAMWDTGSVVPMWAFADTITHILRRSVESSMGEVAETWRPPLKEPLDG